MKEVIPMKQPLLLPYGKTEALKYACSQLQKSGFVLTDAPSQAVTHLLLPVPSFEPNGSVKGGGNLTQLLSRLPKDITIIGGNLSSLPAGYSKLDLLQSEIYLSKNAAITAHCAIKLTLAQLPCTLDGCPVLVVGWGRIGKCLSKLLAQIGARVTVAARKETDRAMLAALGYQAVAIDQITPEQYRVIFNTAPQLLLPDCSAGALKIDLASKPGITGPDVIWARGLPNKDAPESSGALIAEHIANYLMETEVTT